MDQKPHFLQAVVAVLSAFIGIRKGKSSFADQGIKPFHIIAAGLLATTMFVGVLLLIVRFIIRAAGS